MLLRSNLEQFVADGKSLHYKRFSMLVDGKTRFRRLRLVMGPEQALKLTVEMFLPNGDAGPYPAIVRVGLGCPIVAEINERGYALVCFQHTDLDAPGKGFGKQPGREGRIGRARNDFVGRDDGIVASVDDCTTEDALFGWFCFLDQINDVGVGFIHVRYSKEVTQS